MKDRSRRDFVALTVAGLGSAILAPGCGLFDRRSLFSFRPDVPKERLPPHDIDLVPVLRRYFDPASLDRVRWVGRAYLQRFTPDVEAAIADVSESVTIMADAASTDRAVQALSEAVAADFEAVEVVSVFGWQLALAEARACALTDLLLGG